MSEGSSKEESKQEQPTKEESKQEQPTKEESKQEQPTKEEPETAVEKKEEEKAGPKEYTKEEIEEINKKVEVPSDVVPSYIPKNILSDEYGGTSNYEMGIKMVREEIEHKLKELKKDPESNKMEIRQAEEDLKTLDALYENYYIGMNVFRTAKGGRAKLRE